jgi:thiamine pyrophosphate-dependent acetolactate synthase large subunit-like protein
MMTHREVLEVVAAHRGPNVVVTTMGSVGLWPAISDSPLDFHFMPSSMGQAVPLALGLSLAREKAGDARGVIVLCGDGGLLMNLGCLVTLAQHAAPVYVVLVDNGLYEVTGGQPVAGAGRTDFAGLARSAGISRVSSADTLDAWRAIAAESLSGPGPVFVSLKVAGERGKVTPSPPRPMADQIARLRGALGVD